MIESGSTPIMSALLNLELLGDLHGLLFLDAEVTGGVLDGLVTEEDFGRR